MDPHVSAFALDRDGDVLELRAFVPLMPGAPSGWQQVAMVGEWRGHKAGPFELTREDLAEIVATFERHAQPLQVDLGHNSVKDEAPAIGWIHEMRVNGDRLEALIEFDAEMAAEIKRGRFKFTSPVLVRGLPDPVTADTLGWFLESVAVTNKPFLRGMAPLQLSQRAAASSVPQEFSMSDPLKDVRKALGLAKDAPDAQVLAVYKAQAALAAALADAAASDEVAESSEAPESEGEAAEAKAPESSPAEAPAPVAVAASAPEGAPPAAPIAASLDSLMGELESLTPDELTALAEKIAALLGGATEPAPEMEAMAASLKATQETLAVTCAQRDASAKRVAELESKQLDDEIERYVSTGRLLDEHRDRARKLIEAGQRDLFEAAFPAGKPVVPVGRVTPPDQSPGETSLTDDDKAEIALLAAKLTAFEGLSPAKRTEIATASWLKFRGLNAR